MLAHEPRQFPSWLIFDVRQKSAVDSTATNPMEPTRRKRKVWPLNSLAGLLLFFTLALSSHDSVTRLITILCHTIALGASYFSLRFRFNVVGLVLLLLAAYFYVLHLFVILERKA